MNRLIVTFIFFFGSSFLLRAQEVHYTKHLITKEKIGVNKSKLKLEGFYYNKRIRIDKDDDTIRAIMQKILYKNGFHLNNDLIGNNKARKTFKKNGIKCKLKPRQSFENILEYAKCRIELIDNGLVHSVYSVDSNIIRIQYLGQSRFTEDRGIILNDRSFLINKRIDYITKKVIDLEDVYYFKAAKKPDSTKVFKSDLLKKYYFN